MSLTNSFLREKTRLCPYLFASILFIVFSLRLNAQDVKATFSNPVFKICEEPMDLPNTIPNSQKELLRNSIRNCPPNQISGRQFVATFAAANGNVPAGNVVMQNLVLVGIIGVTNASSTTCGDDLTPVIIDATEYFTTPVADYQTQWLCCEWNASMTASAQTTFLPLPQGSPPMPQGERAAFFYKNHPLHKAVKKQIRKDATLYWGYKYDYDGCEPTNPNTPCGKTHCLEIWHAQKVAQAPPLQDPFGIGPKTVIKHEKHIQ